MSAAPSTSRNQPYPSARHRRRPTECLLATLERLEAELVARPKPWPFGAPGVVECAWFANLIAAQPLGFQIDAARFENVLGWLAAMREHPVFANDRRRTAKFLKTLATSNHERRRLFWSGDRLEWLLANGFHDWLIGEIRADRASFPHQLASR